MGVTTLLPSRRRVTVVVLALASLTGLASAQDALGRVRGRVTNSANGSPIVGAQVFVAGDRQGTLSGADGAYLITGVVPGARTIRLRALGYSVVEKPVTVTAGGTATLDFTVVSAPVALNEIVVTGTAGSARKREVGNSIGQVKVADLPEVPSNVSTLLAGRIAGVTVGGGVGNAGGGQAIRLRGTTSVSLTNQPLIYIDGVRTRSDEYPRNGIFTGATQRGANSNSSPLNDINPDDIDRIEVVKGAAAATLFGTDAAAGVIQIFTKRGAQGPRQVEHAVQLGHQQAAAVRHGRRAVPVHGPVPPQRRALRRPGAGLRRQRQQHEVPVLGRRRQHRRRPAERPGTEVRAPRERRLRAGVEAERQLQHVVHERR